VESEPHVYDRKARHATPSPIQNKQRQAVSASEGSDRPMSWSPLCLLIEIATCCAG
jgi:hypothetical protein